MCRRRPSRQRSELEGGQRELIAPGLAGVILALHSASLYGVGTALPVVAFAVILAFATNRLSKAFNALTVIERWMRRITGVVFILVGGYYCLVYLFRVL